MKQLKTQCALLLFILHQSLCQQSSQQYGQQASQQYNQQQSQPQQQYNQAAQYTQTPQPGKVQLEDIERDNLKSSQTPATTVPQQQVQVQPQQQFITYPQDQLFYTLQPQQAAALFQTPGQQPVTSLYAAQPSANGLVSPQQQQLFVQPYYTQQAAPQSYPSYVDFSQFQLYPSVLPYVLPQGTAQNGQVAQVSPNVVNDYFKSAAAAVQPSAAQIKTPQLPQVQASVKTAQTTQVPTLNNYLLGNTLGNTLPNTYYQPVSFAAQPQNPQYYSYNSFYQVQNPAAKSVFSSGIKSTTPSIPTKLKDEPFVPVNNGNYRYDFATAEQNNYNKVRVTG